MKKALLGILTFILMISLTACVLCACTPQEPASINLPKLSAPQNIGIEDNEIYWDYVENSQGYVVSISGVEIEAEQTFYIISDFDYKAQTILIKAIGDSINYSDSDWSEFVYTPTFEEQPTAALKYTLLSDGSGYEVARLYDNVNKGLEGRVYIPDYYKGLPVTKIADSAFSKSALGANIENNVTTSVRLPSYLKCIGDDAFYKMMEIEEIEIPEGVISIGEHAFSCCEKLSKINLPSNLTEIPDGMLPRTAITEIDIPENVTRIGNSAFVNCVNLYKIKLPQNLRYVGYGAFLNTAWYDSQPDGFVIIREDILCGYKGDMADGNLVIPQQVKYIAGGIFRVCESLISITLPQHAQLIGGLIFNRCHNLTKVILSSDLEEIPGYTFYECKSLLDIVIPKSVKKIGWNAFSSCALQTVYYTGTEDEWAAIEMSVGNFMVSTATKYFYSETEPEVEGNFWHYVDGNVVIWTKEN